MPRWLKSVRKAFKSSTKSKSTGSMKTQLTSAKSVGGLPLNTSPLVGSTGGSSYKKIGENNNGSLVGGSLPPPHSPLPVDKSIKAFQVIQPTKKVATEDDVAPLMQYFQGKVAIVVGAHAGVGFAVCKALTQYGFRVVGCAKTDEVLKLLSQECKERNYKGELFYYKSALQTEQDVQALFNWTYEQFGHVDMVVNNPDLLNDKAFKRIADENLVPTIDQRLQTLVVTMDTAASLMSQKMNGKGGVGYIFNICSANDTILRAYRQTISKLSSEDGKDATKRIKVYGVIPGKLEQDLYRRAYGSHHKALQDSNPVNETLFYPQDIANSLVYAFAKIH